METPRKEASELIKGIAELIKENYRSQENPGVLSSNLSKIADLNWGLAQWYWEFDELERGMKAELDLDKADIINTGVDAGDSVAKSEVRATIQLAPKRLEYNKMVTNVEKIKVTMRANLSVIETGRSQLSLIKEKIQNG